MNSAADLSGIFIVSDVTALAFAQIINVRETDWIVIRRQRAKPGLLAGLFTFCPALTTFKRGEIETRFRLTKTFSPNIGNNRRRVWVIRKR